jgi:hypothetical protein
VQLQQQLDIAAALALKIIITTLRLYAAAASLCRMLLLGLNTIYEHHE